MRSSRSIWACTASRAGRAFWRTTGSLGRKRRTSSRPGLKAKAYDFVMAVVPRVPARDLPRLYTDYDWNLGRTHCPIAYVEPTIDDGRHACNLFTDEPLAMGNVYGRPSSTSGLGNASRRSAACWRARAGSCRSAIAAANSRKRSPRDTTRGPRMTREE